MRESATIPPVRPPRTQRADEAARRWRADLPGELRQKSSARAGLLISVAVAGKLGGTSIAGRLIGLNWKESVALGSLMNTRGLMELVVLNIGLDIKIISPQLFSMMVIMAVVTTMMTPPLLQMVYPARSAHSRARSESA